MSIGLMVLWDSYPLKTQPFDLDNDEYVIQYADLDKDFRDYMN